MHLFFSYLFQRLPVSFLAYLIFHAQWFATWSQTQSSTLDKINFKMLYTGQDSKVKMESYFLLWKQKAQNGNVLVLSSLA